MHMHLRPSLAYYQEEPLTNDQQNEALVVHGPHQLAANSYADVNNVDEFEYYMIDSCWYPSFSKSEFPSHKEKSTNVTLPDGSQASASDSGLCTLTTENKVRLNLPILTAAPTFKETLLSVTELT